MFLTISALKKENQIQGKMMALTQLKTFFLSVFESWMKIMNLGIPLII